MAKKKLDPWEDLSDAEKEEKLQNFRDLDISPEEERAMIWAAIKTLVPPVVLVLALLTIIIFVIFR